jgi:Tfp pilus assembly protein PilZ
MAESRRYPRRAQRLRVRFWERGRETEAHVSFTSDVSDEGLFVVTERPAPLGARIRLELFVGDFGILLEGLVIHSQAIAPELRKVRPGGMGVRLLDPAFLLWELASRNVPASSEFPAISRASTPAMPAASAPPSRELPVDAAAPAAVAGAYSMRFADRRSFLSAYDQDVRLGTMFIPSPNPANVGATVTIAIQVPGIEHVFEGQAKVTETKVGHQPGMRVRFLEPTMVAETLGVLARAFRKT